MQTQTITSTVVTNYGYDIANRLTSVNGQTYTWDNNGNLLNDGTSAYTYTQANRLAAVSQQSTVYSFAYNGVGDRLRQTVGITPTIYALDPAAGLTQVLSDGSSTYLYGNGRIAQQQTTKQYFGADALGSVRQIYNSSGQIIANKRYDPYGNVLAQNGVGTSNYGFTGEWMDATGLEYLRARYYAPGQGRFVTKDTWEGDYRRPETLDKWVYVTNNPVNAVDPTGLQQFKIWAAAFISPQEISFPYVYLPKYWDPTYQEQVFNVPIGAATMGTFHGDDRGFNDGGSRVSSRVWHEVTVETNPLLPAEISNNADTGTTVVDFTYYSGPAHAPVGFGKASAKAPPPPKASVTRQGATTKVEIENSPASGTMPLGLPFITPYIRYKYSLEFDMNRGKLVFEGKHSLYPWQELYVSGVPKASVKDSPGGFTGTPFDLAWGELQIKPSEADLPVSLVPPAGVYLCRTQ